MSKQQDAKTAQGYTPKAEPTTCGNCIHFRSELDAPEKYGYQKEINIRCGLGGFAVKKLGTCNQWAKKENQS